MRMAAAPAVTVASAADAAMGAMNGGASAGENLAERVAQAVSQGSNGNVATIQASAHANPETSTITVDVEATMQAAGANGASQGFGGTSAGGNTSRPKMINPNDFGVDPGEAMVCDGCQ